MKANITTTLTSLIATFMLTILIISCEQDTINPVNAVEQNKYVFEGLKPLNYDAQTKRQGATYFERDEAAFRDLLIEQPTSLTFNIPKASQTIELELEKWSIFSDDAVLKNENGQIMPIENTGIFYNGKVKGDPNSTVAVSIFESELSVSIVSSDKKHVVKQVDGLTMFYQISKDDFNLSEYTQQMACYAHVNTNLPAIETKPSIENVITQRANCDFDPIRIRYIIDDSFIKYFNNNSQQALNYFNTRFNEVKSIYNAKNLPIYISQTEVLSYNDRIQISSNTNNALGDMYSEFQSRFGQGSHLWDVNAAVVAVDQTGGTSGTILGGGYATVADGAACSNSAPICKKGAGVNMPGCMPVNLTGLHAVSGSADDIYFTHVLAHELGHNFGISQEFDNVSGDIMDHWAANNTGSYPLHIAHNTYTDMYYAWANCYYNCN